MKSRYNKPKVNSSLDDDYDDELYDDIDYEEDKILPKPERRDEFRDDFLNNSYDDFSRSSDYGDTPMERHGDLLKDLTDYGSYVKELVNGWLGLHWDMEKGKYVRNPDIDPIMNKKCATWCSTYLITYVRKNNFITHIDKDSYNYIIKDMIDVIWLNVAIRKKDFGIKSNGDVLRICTELQHAAELTLMGAGGGKYSGLLMGVYSRNEGGMQQPVREEKRGFLERTKNWLLG